MSDGRKGPKGPAEMVDAIVRNLKETTGRGLEEWTALLQAAGITEADPAAAWLTSVHGVTGGRARTIVHVVFGLPDWAANPPDALVEGQYGGARAALRPVYDRLIEVARAAGPEIAIEPRKTYTTLRTPRRQFAVVQATTQSRIDLGLRLGDTPAEGRLEPAKNLGNEAINRKIELASVGDVDATVLEWLRRAYAMSC